MKTQDYINANKDKMTNETAAAIDELNETQLGVLLETLEDLEGDTEWPSWAAYKTQGTIADYVYAKNNSWTDSGVSKQLKSGMLFRDVQTAKFQERQDVVIIEMGDFRLGINCG